MDYPPPDCSFTAQFGHCSQELINLLLTGAATSNVFDGVMDMGGLPLKGVMSRPRIGEPERGAKRQQKHYAAVIIEHNNPRMSPSTRCLAPLLTLNLSPFSPSVSVWLICTSSAGYLTQIEALRYVQVGTFYKTPSYPLWVVGSQSHFSVLFSLTMDPIEESASDQILEQCRRAFRVIDGDGAGFIQMTSLTDVLAMLDLTDKVGDNLTKLANDMEECNAGIILWDQFWKKISRLMTGASIESVLDPTMEAAGVEGDGGAKFEVEVRLDEERRTAGAKRQQKHHTSYSQLATFHSSLRSSPHPSSQPLL